MVYHRLCLATGILLLLATACDLTSNVIATETASSFLPTTALPTLPFGGTAADTMFPQTTITLTSTIIPSPSASPLLEETVTSTAMLIVGEHRVSSGEALSCIGRGYGVLPKAIADANGLELVSALSAGQILKIPRVQWTNIPVGPVCRPQFTPPFPNLWVTNTYSPPTDRPATATSGPGSSPTDIPQTLPTDTPQSPPTDTPETPPTNTPQSPPTYTYTPEPPGTGVPPTAGTLTLPTLIAVTIVSP